MEKLWTIGFVVVVVGFFAGLSFLVERFFGKKKKQKEQEDQEI